jgi:hypothetical protein
MRIFGTDGRIDWQTDGVGSKNTNDGRNIEMAPFDQPHGLYFFSFSFYLSPILISSKSILSEMKKTGTPYTIFFLEITRTNKNESLKYY